MLPAEGTTLWVERRKWPDAPHYGSEGVVLGEDDHGVWVGTGPGNPVYRGGEELFIGERPVVWCLPRADWFMAHFIADHPSVAIYVDVATPPVWDERGVHMIDLDFDVVVWSDGRGIELVDADEFEQHRVELGYPDDLVAGARQAAADVFARVKTGAGPFSLEAAAPWLAALASHTGR